MNSARRSAASARQQAVPSRRLAEPGARPAPAELHHVLQQREVVTGDRRDDPYGSRRNRPPPSVPDRRGGGDDGRPGGQLGAAGRLRPVPRAQRQPDLCPWASAAGSRSRRPPRRAVPPPCREYPVQPVQGFAASPWGGVRQVRRRRRCGPAASGGGHVGGGRVRHGAQCPPGRRVQHGLRTRPGRSHQRPPTYRAEWAALPGEVNQGIGHEVISGPRTVLRPPAWPGSRPRSAGGVGNSAPALAGGQAARGCRPARSSRRAGWLHCTVHTTSGHSPEVSDLGDRAGNPGQVAQHVEPVIRSSIATRIASSPISR